MNGERNIYMRFTVEQLRDLLEDARKAGAEDVARRIWDALCEKHGHRCELCRVCAGWKKGDYARYRTK